MLFRSHRKSTRSGLNTMSPISKTAVHTHTSCSHLKPPPEDHRRTARLSCRIAAVLSTWSKSPSTRVTVTTFSRKLTDPNPRVNIYDVTSSRGDDDLDILAIRGHYSFRERIFFHTAPNATGRTIVACDPESNRLSTFSLSFRDKPDNGQAARIESRDSPVIRKLPESADNLNHMDPLGYVPYV